jgi:CheY-like chemotaxis protein
MTRILVVEDDEENMEIISEYLLFGELSLDFAQDGEIAIDLASKNEYDLILMDLMMPNMDGLMATRNIRKLPNPYAATVPIIAATARNPALEFEMWKSIGINDYVHKPFTEDDLWEVIHRYV